MTVLIHAGSQYIPDLSHSDGALGDNVPAVLVVFHNYMTRERPISGA